MSKAILLPTRRLSPSQRTLYNKILLTLEASLANAIECGMDRPLEGQRVQVELSIAADEPYANVFSMSVMLPK